MNFSTELLPRLRRLWHFVRLAFILTAALFVLGGAAVPPGGLLSSVRGMTRPIEFDYGTWTLDAALAKLNGWALSLSRFLSPEAQSQIVLETLAQVRRVNALEAEVLLIDRISSYLTSLNNPLESSYHIQRSLEAIVKGGWFGVGIGQADTKFTGLPLAPTDSIFAVLVEETGIIGGVFVTILYTLLVWRGLVIARNAPDKLGSLLAFGLTAWIGIEAMMNMAVIVGLLPFTGNALPFISAGGSSLVVTLTSIGIIMNISRMSIKHNSSERSPKHAVVDLRRRNGRGSVSRNNRS